MTKFDNVVLFELVDGKEGKQSTEQRTCLNTLFRFYITFSFSSTLFSFFVLNAEDTNTHAHVLILKENNK